MFKVEIIGNLGADVEMKTSNGSSYAFFRVAHSEKYQNPEGIVEEHTIWVSCFCRFKSQAVYQYLTRGKLVFVRGDGSLRVYKGNDGFQHAGLSVNVAELQLCGGGSPSTASTPFDELAAQTANAEPF